MEKTKHPLPNNPVIIHNFDTSFSHHLYRKAGELEKIQNCNRVIFAYPITQSKTPKFLESFFRKEEPPSEVELVVPFHLYREFKEDSNGIKTAIILPPHAGRLPDEAQFLGEVLTKLDQEFSQTEAYKRLNQFKTEQLKEVSGVPQAIEELGMTKEQYDKVFGNPNPPPRPPPPTKEAET